MEGKFHDFKGGCSGKTCTEFYIPVDYFPQIEIQDVPAVVIEGGHNESDDEENEQEEVRIQPVGATYEENFMRKTGNRSDKRFF